MKQTGKTITEYFNDDNQKVVTLGVDESGHYCLDFYRNEEYQYSVSYPESSFNVVKDYAEDYALQYNAKEKTR